MDVGDVPVVSVVRRVSGLLQLGCAIQALVSLAQRWPYGVSIRFNLISEMGLVRGLQVS